MSNLIDVPDYQQGIYSPQTLLVSVAGAQASVTVPIPINATTLWVLAPHDAALVSSLTVQGVASSEQFPAYKIPAYEASIVTEYIVPINSANSPTVSITWSNAPTGPWYVVADTSSRFQIEAGMATLIVPPGTTAPPSGLQIGGTDGTNLRAMSTDTHGRQVPLVPTNTTGFVQITANPTTILAAPGSGANYLFGWTLSNDAAGTAQQIDLDSPAGTTLDDGNIIAGLATDYPKNLNGYRTTSAVTAHGAAGAAAHTFVCVRYAPGP